MVWRAQEDHRPHKLYPGTLRLCAVVIGAARKQTTHAMPNDRVFFKRDKPSLDKLLSQLSEFLTIGGNMSSGVVAYIERCCVELLG